MKTILVTGGSGLVGSAIQSIVKDYTYYFIFLNSKKCDLTDYTQTKKVFDEIRPDYIIHLAACVGGLYKNMSSQIDMYEINTLLNTNVLKAAKAVGVKNLIACLSTCIFPDKIKYPINETMLHDGPPHPSNECYAYAKRMLEVQCKHYNFTCIIPTNVYGPHDNFNLEDGHVIPALIHKCYLAKQNGTPFYMRGTGRPLRQFIYSVDLARLILGIIDKGITETLILSPSEEYMLYDVAKMINTEFGGNEVCILPEYADGQYRKTADNSRLMEHFPNFEFTDLKTGIHQTVCWFIDNYNLARK